MDEIQFTTVVQDDSLLSAAETAETTEASITTTETSVSVDYDIKHIQHNSDGIFLMTAGIFFLLVIYFIGKFIGNFLTM